MNQETSDEVALDHTGNEEGNSIVVRDCLTVRFLVIRERYFINSRVRVVQRIMSYITYRKVLSLSATSILDTVSCLVE